MKRIIIFVSMLFVEVCAYAQTSNTALDVTRIVRDPVISGMAGAGSALGSAAWATFGNSAMLPYYEDKFDIATGYQNWAPKGISTGNVELGGAFKIADRFGIATGFVYQSGNPYDIFDDNGNVSGSYKPSDFIFGVSFAYRIASSFSIGANIRYSSEKLSTLNSYGAVSADVYCLFHKNSWDVTAGVINIGSSVKSVSEVAFSLPASMKIATDYKLSLGRKSRISFAADFDYFFCGGLSVAGGTDCRIVDIVSLRAGYNMASGNSPIPSHASIGAGLRFAGFRIDFSYLLANPNLVGSMLFCLGYSF